MVLTRYAMLGPHFGEELGSGPSFAAMKLFEALADTFLCVSPGGEVKEPVVLRGILHDRFRPSVHGERYRAASLLELGDEFGGVLTKVGEGLDFLGRVEHRNLRFQR
jgi:hypothetical protein